MPQKYTYHFELKDLLTQFLQGFDGAIIKRYNDARVSDGNVGVRYVYSPKQRVLFDLVDKAQHITLPCVAFNITSISRDITRVFNKLEGFYYTHENDFTQNRHILQPVPINVNINVSIMTKFQTDMDQILSNFVPYNDPYFIISWTRDGLPYKEIRTEVLWSGNLALSYPMDLNNNQPARVVCDTSFIIKGWLFKADSNPVGKIFKVDSNFAAVSSIPASDYSIELLKNSLEGYNSFETVTVSARPELLYSDRYLATSGASGLITIYGNMFSYTNGVYLSGSNGVFTNTTILTAFEDTNITSIYPTLSGIIPATSYSIETNNKLILTYSTPISTGYFDIIVTNPAGYGILSRDSYIHYSDTQLPYALKGIEVR